jgi:MOSC domain-containing protein
MATAIAAGTVASLHRYPIKSMMGEELEVAEVTERGIFGDRGYALVDTETGKVVSAKNPRKWARMFECEAAYVEPPVTGKPLPPVQVMLPDGGATTSDEPGFASALSKFFGRVVTLKASLEQMAIIDHFWFDYQSPLGRPIDSPEGDSLTTVPIGFGAPGTFFDYTPIHMLTTSTLGRLRELYPDGQWEVRRFRPNIVVETEAGQDGFVEDEWIGRELKAGDVSMKVIDTMVRCVMTTLPQGELPNDPKILRTLADHHRVLMPAVGKELPAVGVAVTVTSGGRISRNDAVTVQAAA